MKTLFDSDSYNEIIKRIETVTYDAQPLWGKMNSPQMIHHCQKALEIPLEKATVKSPGLFMKLLMKTFKTTLYNDKPWRQNLPTAKEFLVRDDKDFEPEKEHLLCLLEEFYSKGINGNFPIHPIFGRFTNHQWGQSQYKHMDHHLRQFNC